MMGNAILVVPVNLQVVGFDSASLGCADTLEFLNYLIPLKKPDDYASDRRFRSKIAWAFRLVSLTRIPIFEWLGSKSTGNW